MPASGTSDYPRLAIWSCRNHERCQWFATGGEQKRMKMPSTLHLVVGEGSAPNWQPQWLQTRQMTNDAFVIKKARQAGQHRTTGA